MVETDGEWHTSDNKHASPTWRATHPAPTASTSALPPPRPKACDKGKGRNQEVFVLSDSEDEEEEENRVKRELSPSFYQNMLSAQNSMNSVGTAPPASQVTGGASSNVIDLTLSDDEEEEEAPPPRPAPLPSLKRKADHLDDYDDDSLGDSVDRIVRRARADFDVAAGGGSGSGLGTAVNGGGYSAYGSTNGISGSLYVSRPNPNPAPSSSDSAATNTAASSSPGASNSNGAASYPPFAASPSSLGRIPRPDWAKSPTLSSSTSFATTSSNSRTPFTANPRPLSRQDAHYPLPPPPRPTYPSPRDVLISAAKDVVPHRYRGSPPPPLRPTPSEWRRSSGSTQPTSPVSPTGSSSSPLSPTAGYRTHWAGGGTGFASSGVAFGLGVGASREKGQGFTDDGGRLRADDARQRTGDVLARVAGTGRLNGNASGGGEGGSATQASPSTSPLLGVLRGWM